MCGWQNHCEVVSVAFQQKAHSHIACVDSCGWSLQEKRTTIKKGMAKYMAMAEATLGDEVWIGYLNRDSNREMTPNSGHVIFTSGQRNNPFELLSLVLSNVRHDGGPAAAAQVVDRGIGAAADHHRESAGTSMRPSLRGSVTRARAQAEMSVAEMSVMTAQAHLGLTSTTR